MINNRNGVLDEEILRCVMQGMGVEPTNDPFQNLDIIMNYVKFDDNYSVNMPGCTGEIWNISFGTTKGVKINIPFRNDAKVKDIIRVYLEKFGLHAVSDVLNRIRFVYNAKLLNINSEQQIKNVNLKNDAQIVVYDPEGIIKSQSPSFEVYN